ncbi:SusD/RagB family nutrient-binding outer membrane lipoprotein [Pedobacter miscanthi]|uniref:SusD/RagB family nutrient-binding outer membrane lipoprotein n=1 Tax=Pedobacter miscanthi TaxID=2259170 RepID=A0A366KW27_9SPHI|nr:SusD/RagB family nutrient-binding outer membrane lipoprotein [Pedobacter miscanthi]RBQ05865.1 SusD/RagB family nutrient-binding outer membrane lipoprotein [Pedobacter miscanthi]
MKKIFILFFAATVGISLSSCKKYLDINTNTNQPTSGTPELVLPQALTAVAGLTWGQVPLEGTPPNSANATTSGSFNFYGSQVVGYVSNGGGVSGWGAIISYDYASTDWQRLWNNSYDVATDLQYVIDNTEGKAGYAQFNAAAKVMKAYTFQRLVDQYGDVPYSDALKGAASVTPKYDKATDIYKSLADLCDAAIVAFKANPAAASNFKGADVMFGSSSSTTVEITRWIQLANTLKLRLILRGGTKVAFTNKTFDAAGFLTDDAQVNPGYGKVSGKQNPGWNGFTYSFAGAAVAAGAQYTPTPFIMGFYNGSKLSDVARANVVYKSGTATATNQLGNQLATAGRGAVPNSWFRGTSSTSYESIGIFKGPDAAQPILLAADSYFLQAEAIQTGLLTGAAQTAFNSGIQASFRYLYKTNTGAIAAGKDPVADAAAYQVANAGSYLANYNLALTPAQQLEAIITQKYIALNLIFGDEAWNEYRRTGYPASNSDINQATPAQTIVSIAGLSTAADKLPARLLYPSTEFTYNSANVPSGINKYTSKIFWAR